VTLVIVDHLRADHVDQDDDDGAVATAQRTRCLRILTVAQDLDVSVSSVRRLIRNGELEAVRIGNSVRVTEVGLDRLLKAGRHRYRRLGKK
jgi:excisionase family DNA binding protein